MGSEMCIRDSGTTYRMGKPTKAILAAGVSEVLLSDNADRTIVAAGIKALYGTKYAYTS